jgi:hypothetical protein
VIHRGGGRSSLPRSGHSCAYRSWCATTLAVLVLLAGTASAQTGEIRKADPYRGIIWSHAISFPSEVSICVKVAVWYSRIPGYMEIGEFLLSLPSFWRTWRLPFSPSCHERYLFTLGIGTREIIWIRGSR